MIKKSPMIAVVFLMVVVTAATMCLRLAVAGSCEDLASLTLPDTTITLAMSLPAGANPAPVGTLPVPICRVAGVIKPTTDSNINFEVWMPTTGWNRKFNGVGNGGLSGSIGYSAMKTPLGRGYATASTDTGHIGSSSDGSWAMGHPEKVIDFGYRAVHEMTVKAKAIVEAFYGGTPQYSYFTGCSAGGKQALKEAQFYPADYDGIVAGAAVNFWTHQLQENLWDAYATLLDPASYLTASKLLLIYNAVLAACDGLDGLMDGLIDDPLSCKFDPAILLCPGADAPTCLTAAQLEAVKKIYAGPKNPRTGEQIYTGRPPGSETGWSVMTAGPMPDAITYDGMKYMTFEDLTWDWRTFDFDNDTAFIDSKLGPIINSIDPNLQPFKMLGGKLIIYHGWMDMRVSPENIINYRNSVAEVIGTEETPDFLRLFLIPGMLHCSGGPGPNTFDTLSALEQWVEHNTAPDKIIVSHSTGGSVDRTRPLCPYPEVARYSGSGSIDDAANFMCVPPIEVRIEPETLSLKSKGEFTAFITIPEGYDIRDWNIGDVSCEGAPAVKGMVSENTYQAKFKRQDLKNVTPGDAVTLTVKGVFHRGGKQALIQATDTIRVIK